ncbi:MAG TPA: hypothetical protein VHW24_20855 [Bryobacteraceae bacterium]|jgi:hypothetical protein|nr:hypothetical protein [Bryobacteraceae bacterium]
MATQPITPQDYRETVPKDDGSGTKKVKYSAEVTWDVRDLPPVLDGRCTFLHTCTADLGDKQIYATEGDKEFGSGFYTTCGDIETPYQLIADEWFVTKQSRHDWHVIAFSMRTDALLNFLLNNAGTRTDALKNPLHFYLTHSTGYPSGKANPTEQDLAHMNEINLLGRVLILAGNKDTEVSYFGGETTSWTRYAASKVGGGPYLLVIGPQQPLYMLEYRQYAWTPGWGIYLVNSCMRFYKYRNYQIFGKDAGRYRAPLKDKQWPATHPKTKPDGSKFT